MSIAHRNRIIEHTHDSGDMLMMKICFRFPPWNKCRSLKTGKCFSLSKALSSIEPLAACGVGSKHTNRLIVGSKNHVSPITNSTLSTNKNASKADEKEARKVHSKAINSRFAVIKCHAAESSIDLSSALLQIISEFSTQADAIVTRYRE